MPKLRDIRMTLEAVTTSEVQGGKNDGTFGVAIHFAGGYPSVFLDADDACKLRDALNAMTEECEADDDGESWKKGRKEEEKRTIRSFHF
jgi:hypothetical protein